MTRWGFLCLSVLLCTSCRIDPETLFVLPENTRLYIFAAPWCEECPEDIRALENSIVQRYNTLARKVLVTTGDLPSHRPTDSTTAAFADSVKSPIAFESDTWKWVTYKKFVQKEMLSLPAAVVLDAEGNALQVFDEKNFSPEAIVDFLDGLAAEVTP